MAVSNSQDTVYDRLYQKFELDVLEKVHGEVSSGRLQDEGRVRTTIRRDLEKVLTNNLEEDYQLKLLLQIGRDLFLAHELPLSRECYEKVVHILSCTSDSVHNIVVRVQAMHGIIACEHSEITSNPRFVIAPMAMSRLLANLGRLRDSIDMLLTLTAAEREAQAWLILNGCKLVYSIGQPLLLMGCSRYVAESFIYASLAMDAVINLCTGRHLEFKLKLNTAAIAAMLTYASMEETNAAIVYVSKIVQELREREELDPPLTDAAQRALTQAETDIAVMKVVWKFWSDNESLVLGDLRGPHDDSSLPKSHSSSSSLSFAERCLLECCRIQQLTAGNINEPWKKRSSSVVRAFMTFTQPREGEEREQVEDEESKAGQAAHETLPSVTVSVRCLVDVSALAMFDVLDGVASHEVLHRIRLISTHLIEREGDSSVTDLDLLQGLAEHMSSNTPETAAHLVRLIDGILHSDLLRSRHGLMQKIGLALWSKMIYPSLQDLLSGSPPSKAASPTSSVQQTVTPLLAAVRALDIAGIEDPVLMGSVSLLVAHFINLTGDMRRSISLLTKAIESIDNHRAARVDLQLHLPDDVRDLKALQHSSFTCRSDGATQWYHAAKRLGAHAFAGYGLFGAASSMSPTDQALADIHTDLLLVLIRTELLYGISTRNACVAFKANASRQKKAPEAGGAPNDKSKTTGFGGTATAGKKGTFSGTATGVGAKTGAVADAEVDNTSMENVDKLPCVASLKSTWGKSSYGRSILYLEMARVEKLTDKKKKYLRDAMSCVLEAEHSEDSILKAFENLNVVTDATPAHPIVLARSHAFLYVAPVACRKNNWSKVHHMRVFGREEGSGTDVTTSSDELSGCDRIIPAEEMHSPSAVAVKISSLRIGEKYVFASGAFEESGRLLGHMSPTCISVEAVNPLPTLLLWSHIATLAYEAGFVDVVLQAANKVCDYFLKTADPKQDVKSFGKGINLFLTDQYFLNMLAINQASPVQLKLFVHSFLLVEKLNADRYRADPVLDSSAVEVSAVKLHWNFRKQQQLNVLASVIRLSIVTGVASMLQDHDLILRCVCLSHTLLAQSFLFDAIQLSPYVANPVAVFITALQVTPRRNWRELDHQLYCRMLLFASKCAVINGNTAVMAPILENIFPVRSQEPFEDEEPAEAVRFNDERAALSKKVLQDYGGVLHGLLLKGGELALPTVLIQMNALLGIPESANSDTEMNLWRLSAPARSSAVRINTAQLVDAGDDVTGVVAAIRQQLSENPPMASDLLNILVSCSQELDRVGRGIDIPKFLARYPVRKNILADGVVADCEKWNIDFVRNIENPKVAEPSEGGEGDHGEDVGAATPSPRHDVPTYCNPAAVEVKLQFQGIASLCLLIAEANFSDSIGRNDYLDSLSGPFVKLSHGELVEGISESCLDSTDAGLEDAMRGDGEGANGLTGNTDASDAEKEASYTCQDYVRGLCMSVIFFARAECHQSAVDATGKLWSYVLNKWYDPRTFAEAFFSIKSYLLATAESIVMILERQSSAKGNEDVACEAGDETLTCSHSRDIKDNLYILKDPFVFLIKALCLLKQSKEVVDYGSRMLDVFIYHGPEYAKVVADGIMAYLLFAQEEIIAHCADKVAMRERKLNDFVTSYEEAQARKRKKKLRIARAEKSEEELKFEADRNALHEKLSRAQAVHESNCNRKEALERLEKRVDGLFSTGQQLLDKVRGNVSKFLSECRDAIVHEPADEKSFAGALKRHKNLNKKFDDIVHHYDQVSQFLREKKDKVTLVAALHEQGDFLVLFDKVDMARAAWRDAIDGLFNTLDAWKNWQDVTTHALQSLENSVTLTAISLMIILGKLSRHCSESDFDLKSNYCQMAARISRIPFMEGIGHPNDLCGFAAYNCVELGGKSPLEFNRETFTAFSFQSSFEEIIRVLGSEKLQLQCFPVIVLLEHFNGYYTRRVDKWIEARLKRVTFLAELHMFAEATSMLAGALPAMKVISNGLFGDPLRGAVHGTTRSDDGTFKQKADSTSSNGLEFFNNPPFFNNKPPEDEQNQMALKWIASYPSLFEAESSGFIVVLPPIVKTEDQLAAERAMAEAAAEAAAAAAAKSKGKKKEEVVVEPPPPVTPTRPQLSKFHHAEMATVCALLLMEISLLDERTSVKHHGTLVEVMSDATSLLGRATHFLGDKSPDDEEGNDEQKETDQNIPNVFNDEGPCAWANGTWVALFRRCRVLHIRELFWKKDYKTCRATLLGLLKQIGRVSGVFGDAKYELTQLWFDVKQLLVDTANLQGRFDQAITLASQSLQESSGICSGFWIRSLMLRRANIFFKIGNLVASKNDCESVIQSFESAQIICKSSVRAKLLLNTVVHSQSLNTHYDDAVEAGGKCMGLLRGALENAKYISRERGFVGADVNYTFEMKRTLVMRHDRFTPFHHSMTAVYKNDPDLVAFESFVPVFKEEAFEKGTSSFNTHLRPGPVDGTDAYTTCELSSIYIDEVRVLATCYNAFCTLADELRMANISLSGENQYGLSAMSLLQEQVISSEEGLKVHRYARYASYSNLWQVLRFVVYPSPYVKCGLLLSAGKARAAELAENTMEGTEAMV